MPNGFGHTGFLFSLAQHRLQAHHRGVGFGGELSVFIKDISNASTHPGGKVAPGFTKHGHRATRHVFTAMVSRALDHRGRS